MNAYRAKQELHRVRYFQADSAPHDNWRTRHEPSPRTRLLVALVVGVVAAVILWLPVWVRL